MRGAILAVVLILVGCGTAPSSQVNPSITPSGAPALPPTPVASSSAANRPSPLASVSPSPPAGTAPAAGLLFAVIEPASTPGNPDTIAIVGMDGIATAKATFQPRQKPYPGAPVAVPMQPVAQVVGSGVYYMDGYGAVRVLRVNAQPQLVATFPQQPQQYETWFAVSPDGSRIVAGVLQFPAIGPMPSGCTGMCLPPLIGQWNFSLAIAPAGGQTTELRHTEAATNPDADPSGWKPIFPVGWRSAGPVAMVPVYLGTQNFWDGGPLYVIDAAGNLGAQIGGKDCHAASIAPSGFIPCITTQGLVEVRDSNGDVIWATQVQTNADSVYLSPDGQAISDGFSGVVETRAGPSVQLPQGFQVEGFLDPNTVVGRVRQQSGSQGNLAWVSLGDPSTVHDLGFKGDFVATVA